MAGKKKIGFSKVGRIPGSAFQIPSSGIRQLQASGKFVNPDAMISSIRKTEKLVIGRAMIFVERPQFGSVGFVSGGFAPQRGFWRGKKKRG